MENTNPRQHRSPGSCGETEDHSAGVDQSQLTVDQSPGQIRKRVKLFTRF